MQENSSRHLSNILSPGLVLLVSLFLFSTVMWFVQGNTQREYILFFPGAVRTDISGEPRSIARTDSRETQLEKIVNEIILGPLSVEQGRVFNRGTRLNSLSLRRGTLYMDLTAEAVISGRGSNLGYSEAEDALLRSIRFNAPYVRDIIITLDGQIPFEFPVWID
ncbi:hypothetical protein [Spirochaeta dissipatitropha]